MITAHPPFLVAAASLFSAKTQGASPFTSAENSQIGAEKPKPPVSETPSWTISDRSDSSTIFGDPYDDPAAFERARKQGMVSSPLARDSGPLNRDYDKNQHDPTISDTPHVDLTPEPAQGVPGPSSPRLGPSGGKPILTKIVTSPQLESKSSDSPDATFYTPSGNDEAVDRKPFDSAVNIRVVYSDPSFRSRSVGGPARGVVDVHQPVTKWESKYQFPTQDLRLPRNNSKETDDESRHGLRMPLTQPSQVRERGEDSMFSFISSPFDEFRKDSDTSRGISEVNVSTVPGRESGPRPKPKLSAENGGSDIQGNNMFPRQKGKRMVPRWKGSEGRSEEDHTERGKERDDYSSFPTPTDYVSVTGEVDEHPRNQNSTQVSSTRVVMKHTT